MTSPGEFGKFLLASVGRRNLIPLILLLAIGPSLQPPLFSQAPADKRGGERNILVIYSYAHSFPWRAMVGTGFDERIAEIAPGERPTIYEETNDGSRLGGTASAKAWEAFLSEKYKKVGITAIVTESTEAAQVILAIPRLFPEAKRYILHFAASSALAPGKGDEALYPSSVDLGKAIATIWQVLPNTHHVIAVVDHSATGLARLEQLKNLRQAMPQGVDLAIWDNLAFSELYAKAASLPEDAALFYLPIQIDSAGKPCVPADIARELTKAAKVPVFSHFDSLLGTGILGGYLVSGRKLGRLMAELAIFGDAAAPPSQEAYRIATMGYFFDSKALARWKIADEALPPGGAILFREKSFFERYLAYILPAIGLFILQSALIIILIRENKLRKKAREELEIERESLEKNVMERTAELAAANSVLSAEIVERNKAQEYSAEQAREKALLLKELQHRVKNSMGIIASLISVEASKPLAAGTSETLDKLHSRVLALSALYDMLYASGGVEEIELDDYLSRITRNLEDSLGADARGVIIESRLAPMVIDMRRGLSLGLIANELVTDCFKHAFPSGAAGRISISLREDAGRLVLEVTDDGIGLPEAFDPAASAGFGMVLVTMLAEQLGADFQASSEAGLTRFRLTFALA